MIKIHNFFIVVIYGCFKCITHFHSRLKGTKVYCLSTTEENHCINEKNMKWERIFSEMDELQSMFSFKVPKDILQDIAELRYSSVIDYTNLNNGLKVAIIGKRITRKQALIIQQFAYNRKYSKI